MANDANDRGQSAGGGGNSSSGSGGAGKDRGAKGSAGGGKGANRDHTFGKGMTSPDSTEAVLDSRTGEPDPRATGRGGQKGTQDQDLEQDV